MHDTDHAAAIRAAVLAERARFKAVLESQESVGRLALALVALTLTDLEASAILAMLTTAGRDDINALPLAFGQTMAKLGHPNVAPAADSGGLNTRCEGARP